ncbi:MAG: hypothetical protein E7163_03140 [Firmicutes bacterium]|nr:hypothetical protein [Bacillota bacterium]
MFQVSNVKDILNQMNGIEYGYSDTEKNIHKEIDKNFKKNYILSNPEEVINNKVGICYDLVELARACFKTLGKKCNSYFMVYYESKKIHTHTFIVYEENEKFYWFEYAWDIYKGIHEYVSLYDLLTDIRNKFKEFNKLNYMDFDYLCIYKYKKPKYHISLKEFYKHCENGENIII